MNKSRSIGNKLLLMLVGISTLSAVITASVLFINEWYSATYEQQKNLNSISEVLSPNLTTALLFNDSATVIELIKPLENRHEIVYSHVTDVNNIIMGRIGDFLSYNISTTNPSEYIIAKNRLMYEGKVYGELMVIADKSYVKTRSGFYFYFLLVLITANFFICLVVSLKLRKMFVSPILDLASLAKKVSANGDYSLRAHKTTDDEVAELMGHFNQMLEVIEQRDLYLESQVKGRTNEIELANNQLRLQAYHDSLTGLPNRHAFYESLQKTIDHSKKFNLKFSLIFIDLDNFKEVNDTLGHDYGDLLLINTAKRLLGCVRESDIVARLGGDEFTLVIQDLCSKERISVVANDILKSLSIAYQLNDERVFVSGSIGITIYPDDGESVEDLVKHADQAMYESKHAGRNCFHYFTHDLQVNAQNKRALSDDLRRAVLENQFELFYQPIIDLNTIEVVKAEALIRWNHPERGEVLPGAFISLAEEMDLIHVISNWVAHTALRQAMAWRKQGDKELSISINTSPLLYKGAPTWMESWLSFLKSDNVPRNTISIEITEGLLMESSDSVKDQLIALRDYGIEVSIDDFGVGYSSLSYLQKLDIDVLKIDQSFVKDIRQGGDSLALCEAVIVMAHRIGLKVIAEGIENEKQHILLKNAGCDYGQGYYYSEALSAEQFTQRFIKKEPLTVSSL